ncbi:zinc finger B-box domain-containing protein 1 isoform X2 [Ranitomeya variabilis]|uniref:zinc finger B-box domain-containing protein 1 isoform X2 n=2 Tax=Ranitomeya variabilis TaxID=490064 RepID=UPI00405787CB
MEAASQLNSQVLVEATSAASMSGEFVMVPPAKSGNSVRLKARNIRELRKETLQLERQNQEMEQKLNKLRQSMSREKEEREKSNPYHWVSGQVGNQRHEKESTGKFSAGKIKLKVLQNSSSEPEKPKTSSRAPNIPAAEKTKLKGKLCGQCESRRASLMCLECGEDYCTACFTRFHQKGALMLHRTLPIQEKSQDGKLDISHAFKKELNVDETSGKAIKDKEIIGRINSTGISSIKETQGDSGKFFISETRKEYLPGSLLHGTFNEEESAKYFNEALLEWRNEAKNKSRHVNEADDTGSSEVQTVLTATAKPFHIEFKENSLSYMEKLMLKKHRRTPVSQVLDNHLEVRYSPTVSENELDKCCDLTAEEMEAHENYVALFRAEEHVRNDVIHEPALKIVELDKDHEEKLDESRNFVMKETENNEMKSHRLSETATKSFVLARDSLESPERATETPCHVPVRSAYSLEEGVVKFTSLEASHSQDSKSMKYKSFKDSQSWDTALMVNVPQKPQSAVFRQPHRISEYQGLKGFFMLDIEPVEGKAENCQLQSPDLPAVVEEVTYTGNNYWRPESSLSLCADDATVQDIVERAWAQSHNHIIEQSLTPRHVTRPGTASSSSSYSSKSIHRISGSYNSSRPSSAVARPMSRATSEISEIESIDSVDRQDYLFEDENERETLAVLEKEFNSFHAGNRKLQTSAVNYDSFQLTRHGQRLAKSEDEVPLSRLSLHTLQSCAVESESDEEETLQDKLNVLSLQ